MCRSRKKNNVFRSLPDGTRSVPATFRTELRLRGNRLVLELPGHELVGQRSVEAMASGELVDM